MKTKPHIQHHLFCTLRLVRHINTIQIPANTSTRVAHMILYTNFDKLLVAATRRQSAMNTDTNCSVPASTRVSVGGGLRTRAGRDVVNKHILHIVDGDNENIERVCVCVRYVSSNIHILKSVCEHRVDKRTDYMPVLSRETERERTLLCAHAERGWMDEVGGFYLNIHYLLCVRSFCVLR